MFDDVSVFLVPIHYGLKHGESKKGEAVEVYHESFVGALWLICLAQSFLGFNTAFLFDEGQSEQFFQLDC